MVLKPCNSRKQVPKSMCKEVKCEVRIIKGYSKTAGNEVKYLTYMQESYATINFLS